MHGQSKKNRRCGLDGLSVFLCSIQSFKGDAPMTIARGQQIDISVARWYHCMTRCVREALLLSVGSFNRKEWIEDRLEELAQIFAVGVGGSSAMKQSSV
jgi:hypothetical protein